jgi:quercetin dioxygenase-like cupin family protein
MEPMSNRGPTSVGGSHQQPTVLVDGGQSEGRIALVEAVLERGRELPRHRHHWEDEAVYVVAGALVVWLDGAWFDLRSGDDIFLPRGSDHTLVATTDEARLLVVFATAGFEGLCRDLAAEGAQADLERLIAVAARYGVEIAGSSPQATTR